MRQENTLQVDEIDVFQLSQELRESSGGRMSNRMYLQRFHVWHCLTWIVPLLNEKRFVRVERRSLVQCITIDLFQCIISCITSTEKEVT